MQCMKCRTPYNTPGQAFCQSCGYKMVINTPNEHGINGWIQVGYPSWLRHDLFFLFDRRTGYYGCTHGCCKRLSLPASGANEEATLGL